MIEINVTKKLDYVEGRLPLDIDLKINKTDSCIAVTGESGSGKTTLLRMIAGLTNPDSGTIKVNNQIWYDNSSNINISPQKRNIGMVFQTYALFPNMTVKQNVMFANNDEDNANFLLELTRLKPLADKYPAKLSGGQKQRVSLIRAIANRPSLLLLDEPLAAVDAAMRRRLQDELKKIRELFNMTIIIVSHDLDEISKLADRVVVIKHGKIIHDTTDVSTVCDWY